MVRRPRRSPHLDNGAPEDPLERGFCASERVGSGPAGPVHSHQGGTHGRQDTEATAEAEEAEDADGRNPLNPELHDAGDGRSVGRDTGSGQAPAAPVLPGA